jgi:hypothetical protein
VQWVPGAFSPRANWAEREANHLSLSSAEVKNAWSYTYSPYTSLWRGALLGKEQLHLNLFLRVATSSQTLRLNKISDVI